MSGSFLVRLTATPIPDVYVATPIDTSAHPEHPIHYPPGIWGPTDPRPGWGLPGTPPGIWGGNDPFPEHPMDPPPGEKPPEHLPPVQGCKWVYTPQGWYLVCGPTDKPRPPGAGAGAPSAQPAKR